METITEGNTRQAPAAVLPPKLALPGGDEKQALYGVQPVDVPGYTLIRCVAGARQRRGGRQHGRPASA